MSLVCVRLLQRPAHASILQPTITSDAAKKLEFYKRNIIIPPEYLLSLNPSLLLCNTPREDSSTDSIDTLDDVNVIQKVEEYTRKKEEIIKRIDSIVKNNNLDIDKWKIMWQKAIENVIGLYKVKYGLDGDHRS
ncbi:hypothetical protein QE152_g9003 [Popillia japonica]|uniref:Uncharacterized protein n=1 Tax=Popillia japonica TaxID=7064 RepID=A0AAW1M0P7_POPJA